MNKDNLISVIIPVYNSENYLARCLYSILNNTYQEIEIICVNDGSTDESVQILAEYVKKDNRISIINKENGGLSSARNAGMKKCKGKYVTFIDSDDWVHPQYFEFLLFAMQKYDSDAVICSNIIVNNNDENYCVYTKEYMEKEISLLSGNELFRSADYRMYRVYAHGVLYQKEKIRDGFPEGIKVIEDNLFNILTLPLYSKISLVNIPIYFYYINESSIMHTYFCSDVFKGLLWACTYLKDHTDLEYAIKKELVMFIYKRTIFYRFAFGRTEEKKIAYSYVEQIQNEIRNYDDCLGKKKIIYILCVKYPFIYCIFKYIKNGKFDISQLFAQAEAKCPI